MKHIFKTICPKCEGYFLRNGNNEFCPTHQKEYDDWLNTAYIPESSCDCGCSEYIDGELQMTEPPSYPLMQVYRCKECNKIRAMNSKDGKKRIVVRE